MLCVENVAFSGQIRRFLNGIGLQVVEADDPSEVLDRAGHPWSQVDLLLTDTRIHGGPDPVSEAMRQRSDLMLLVISGDPEYINRALVSDTRVEFIEKPFAWCELREKLQQILHTRALACRDSETAFAA